jgi:hypothetical protein
MGCLAGSPGVVYRVRALFAANLKVEMKISLCGHDRKVCEG